MKRLLLLYSSSNLLTSTYERILLMVEAILTLEIDKESYVPSTLQQEQREHIEETIKTSEKILGLKDSYILSDILSNFELCWEIAYENEKGNDIKELTDSKNYLERIEILTMVSETERVHFTSKDGKKKRFDLLGKIPFKRVCWKCHGTGETYKFHRSTITSICKLCNGQGVAAKKKCPICNGRDGEVCKACNNTGEITPICRACRGTKLYHQHPIIAKLETTTMCSHCQGRGFPLPKKVEERKSKIPDNPVISKNLGEQIKSVVE